MKLLRGRTEKEFQGQIVQLANLLGWLVYHTHDSRRCAPGFPDLLLLRGAVLIVAELKVGNNKLSPQQRAWLSAFRAAGIPAYEWRPGSWPEIESVLRSLQGVTMADPTKPDT